MNQNANKTQKKSRGWLWKIPLGLLVLLLIVLAVATLSINTIANNQINGAMKDYLTEGGSLEAIDIGLMAGRIELSGMTVNPPKGHGTDPLLSLGNLILDVVPTSLLSDVIVVEELALKGMSLNLVRDKQGQLGLDKLVKTEEPAAETADKADASPQERDLPVVQVNSIRLEDGSITVRDSALTGKPMVFPLKDLQVMVSQLRLFDDNAAVDPASISVSFQLKQPGKLPSAHFGTVARMGPVGRGTPPVNAQVCMIGLKLKTLGTLLPPATRDALGGDGLDGGLVLALNNGRINLDALALTDRNIRYDTIHVRGTLDAPVVEIAPVLAGVFRVTDGVLSIGKSGLATGVSLAQGGVDVAKKMGSGTVKTGKKFLGGLFDTGKGIATLDAKQMGKGIVGSTAGTIDHSLDSAKDAGSAAGGGVGKSVSDLTGSAAVKPGTKAFRPAMKPPCNGREGTGENAISAGYQMKQRGLSLDIAIPSAGTTPSTTDMRQSRCALTVKNLFSAA